MGSDATETLLTPIATAAGETQSPSPFAHTSPEAGRDDLRLLAVSLTERARAGDWDAIRPYLVDALAASDDGVLHRFLASLLVPANVGIDAPEWEVEEYRGWTTVRLSDIPFVALIFRQRDDETYFLDPGPHAFDRATEYASGATPEAESQLPDGYQQELLFTDVDDILPISRHLKRSLHGISRDGSGVVLTVQWMFVGETTGTLPLDGLRWTSKDDEGWVEIDWTTAVITDGELSFPAPKNHGEGTASQYTVSFEMISAPKDEDVHLLVEGMTLHLPDGDDVIFAIDHTIPGDTERQEEKATLTPQPVSPPASPTYTATSCSAEEIVAIMASFVDAVNRGDQTALDAHLPDNAHPRGLSGPEPGGDQRVFYSFAMDPRGIADPDELLDYFAQRHEGGEQWTLQDMMIGGPWRDPRLELPEVADVDIQLVREADGLQPHTVAGNGTLNCVTGEILMWSTGDHFDEDVIEHSILDANRPVFTPVAEE